MMRCSQKISAYLTALLLTFWVAPSAVAMSYETTVNESGVEVTTMTDENGNTMVFEILNDPLHDYIEDDWEVMSAEEYEALIKQDDQEQLATGQIQQSDFEPGSNENQKIPKEPDQSSQTQERERSGASDISKRETGRSKLILIIPAVLVLCFVIVIVLFKKRKQP